jgi:hypothetical protein
MMIEQAESGLSAANYNALAALTTGATYELTLQRINWALTSLEGTPDTTKRSDAVASDDYVVMARNSGSTTIQVYTIAESGTKTLRDTVTGVQTTAPFGLHYDVGDDYVTLYYASSTTLYYQESSDGGVTWGSAQTVRTLSNIKHVAPTNRRIVHYATNDGNNTRLHYSEASPSWSHTDSDWYYPATLESFDAEALDWSWMNPTLLVFTAVGPVRFRSRNLQGVWGVIFDSEQWGTPFDIDVVDEYFDSDGYYDVGAADGQNVFCREARRRWVRLGMMDDKCLITYLSSDTEHVGTCYAFSGDGIHWQHRQPLGAPNWDGKIVARGNYTYLVNNAGTYRSSSTVLSGNSQVNTTLTSDVESMDISRDRMAQTSIVLANDDGAYTSLVTDDNRYQVKEELGYFNGATPIVQQTALYEVDVVTRSRDKGVDTVTLSARDRLAAMTDRVHASEFELRESQVARIDTFEDLGGTAGHTGSWAVVEADDELILQSNDSIGLALFTVDAHLWNFHAQVCFEIKSGTATVKDAGLMFRSDSAVENFWCASYNAITDTLYLTERRSGSWQTAVDSVASMGWSLDTWYAIRVECYLNQIRVYTCVPGANWQDDWQNFDWTLRITYVDTSSSLWDGYVGVYGQCYSNESDQGCRFDNLFVASDNQPVTLESATRFFGNYAGIHDYIFDDAAMTFGTYSEGNQWDYGVSSGYPYLDGEGLAPAEWYFVWSDDDVGQAFVLDCYTTGTTNGAISVGAEPDETPYGYKSYFFLYWNATEVGVKYCTETGLSFNEYDMCTVPFSGPYTNGNIRVSVQPKDGDTDAASVLYATLWFGHRQMVSFPIPVGGDYSYGLVGAPTHIGFGCFDNISWSGYNKIHIADLDEEIAAISLDVGEAPLGGLRRAIGSRDVELMARFDGALSVRRPAARSVDLDVSDDEAYQYQHQADKRMAIAHWRQVGAWHESDSYDNTILAAGGHRFHKDDNSELMTLEQCEDEAALAIVRENAYAHKGRMTHPCNVFLEKNDRLTQGSDDWLVTSFTRQKVEGLLEESVELRQYPY